MSNSEVKRCHFLAIRVCLKSYFQALHLVLKFEALKTMLKVEQRS